MAELVELRVDNGGLLGAGHGHKLRLPLQECAHWPRVPQSGERVRLTLDPMTIKASLGPTSRAKYCRTQLLPAPARSFMAVFRGTNMRGGLDDKA